MRSRGPITSTSTFPFEGYYAEMRKSYCAGTASTGKQILTNGYVKRTLPYHSCTKKIIYSAHVTSKSRNNVVYIFADNTYRSYKILSENEDYFTCVRLGRHCFNAPETPTIDWSSCGVFKLSAEDDVPLNIRRSDISGKALIIDKFIMSCPNNVLRE